MSQKRQPEAGEDGGGGGSPEEKRQKVPPFQSMLLRPMWMNTLNSFEKILEPLIRRVVKEEVETALSKHLACIKRQSGKQIYPSSASILLELQFQSKLSLPIYTGSKIGGENSVIKLALVDVLTGQVVASEPESSMKVEMVVLEGDFVGDGQDSWTSEEFRSNIVRERGGKRSLLAGDVLVDLHEGIGLVGELSFTDNSSWTRSRKFRLGARVVDGPLEGVTVKEAISEAFVVKDHRGELYKKHYPPSLTDEVWRLEKIGKDGSFHKRLSSENIHTVKDFLTLLCRDATRLRNILGTGMSTKMWEVTVDHARTCKLGNFVNVYYPDHQTETGVVFTILGDLEGIITGERFIPANKLLDSEKEKANTLMRTAFENWEEVVSSDLGAFTGDSSHATPSNLCSSLPTKAFSYDYGHSDFSSADVFNTYFQILDNGESGRQACSSEVSMQYLEPSGLRADSPADLGTVVAGFLRSTARVKAMAGWGTLIYLFRWRFSMKRILASKKSKTQGKGKYS